MSHTDTIPGHIIETIDITIGVLHEAIIPVRIIPTMTPKTTDHPHTGAHQLTLGTTAGHIPVQHTNQVKVMHKSSTHPAELKTSCMIKEI